MTTHKTFKKRVRARMTKTGERYTAARRMLIDVPAEAPVEATEAPAVAVAPAETLVSDEALVRATGHARDHWFGLLDAWGATTRTHTEIARWLGAEHGVASWWRQSITVEYERARGLRTPGQRANGWVVTATKIVAVPVERLFEAVTDESLRAAWIGDGRLRLRTALAPRSARFDWTDGSSRVNLILDALPDGRGRVAVEHERLPDAETAAALKPWWRERVAALKSMLEAGPG